MNPIIQFQKKPESKEMVIKHSYKADLETIWNAFTEPKILEKWWAPLPYKAIVVSNNFKPGGKLHYYMLSPEGEKHYCIAEFISVDPLKSYEVMDAFCDENAVINTEFPRMTWKNDFSHRNGITEVTNTITFSKIDEMTQILEMGFEEGYKMGLNQLSELLNVD